MPKNKQSDCFDFSQFRKNLLIVFSLLVFCFLCSSYLFQFWQSPMIAGADGSGHTALLHLYHKHIFPDLNGWIPGFWGGMPFPIYYPPLFYWLGALLMSIFGIDATLAAKLITTFSFLLLPLALFRLSINIGLSLFESLITVCLAGVIVCGSNVASLSGIGLLGLFEVGLYSQTLGFAFFCLWISSLVKAEKSIKETILSIVFLSATILSNVHILPLAAAFAFFWFIYQIIGIWKRRTELRKKQIISELSISVGVLFSPVLISGIWLFPVVWWYQYAVGKTLSAGNLFFSLGSLNLIWIICLFVAWTERKRNKNLAVLCLMILTIAFASLAPVDFLTQSVPFQPARTLSGIIILAVLPIIALLNRLLKEAFDSNEIISAAILVVSVCFLAWLHPPQNFGIAALSEPESTEINQIVKAVNEIESGKILVEIVESQAVFNSPLQNTREMAKSRALSNQIAMNGKPILWSVFREQALSAPFATAVNNLFSQSKEVFGLGGLALQLSVTEDIDLNTKLKLARTLNVTHFLIKSEQQISALRQSPELEDLWQINGWYYFKLKESQTLFQNNSIPIFAWLPAKAKNRSFDQINFFNLAESLAFRGFPEISVLLADNKPENLSQISKIPNAVFVIDTEIISKDALIFIKSITANNQNYSMIIVGNDENFNSLKNSNADNFIILPNDKNFIANATSQIIKWQSPFLYASASASKTLLQTEQTYFPARNPPNQIVFLDGFGRAAFYDSNENLSWAAFFPNVISIIFFILGVFGILGLAYLHRLKYSKNIS